MSIVTDDGSYCDMILNDLKSQPNFEILSSDKAKLTPEGFLLSLPENYGTSFFDQLWKERGRGNRYLIRRQKVSRSEGKQTQTKKSKSKPT